MTLAELVSNQVIYRTSHKGARIKMVRINYPHCIKRIAPTQERGSK